MSYLLAINCGSSSIKGKLYHLPTSQEKPLKDAASLSVSNISSKGEKIKIKIQWKGEEGKDVEEEGDDGGDVECTSFIVWAVLMVDKSLVPLLLEKLTNAGKVDKDAVKYVTHRV
jgi:acetate kinase